MRLSEALRFAINRALAVLWGGLVAALLYLGIVLVGPGLEGRFFPVVTNYQLIDYERAADGTVSFRTHLFKARDCGFYGVNWYAAMPTGAFVKLQLASADGEPITPATGPTGWRSSDRVLMLGPPADALSIVGVMSHDCGLVWQTRTTVGPFDIETGQKIDGAVQPRN